MEDDENTSYRVGSLNDPTNVGKSARTRQLAMFAARDLSRHDCLVLERTKWEKKDGKMRPAWTVIEDAERKPNTWIVGVLDRPSDGYGIPIELE
ncbi:hypothetical protein [Mesorhizobium sp. M0118]|uniref:hypothetical protein n=1 Tax=Mesorhizobium sp. M0118 TaxID=2956884 RepID=UPI0033386462